MRDDKRQAAAAPEDPEDPKDPAAVPLLSRVLSPEQYDDWLKREGEFLDWALGDDDSFLDW